MSEVKTPEQIREDWFKNNPIAYEVVTGRTEAYRVECLKQITDAYERLQSENKQLREKLEKSLSLAISIKNKFSKHGFTCYEDCDLNTNYEDEEVDCTCGVSLSENDIHRYLDSQISTLKQLTQNGGEDESNKL